MEGADGAPSPAAELTDVTDRRVEWMPWPSFLGLYGGGAGLRHRDPIFAVTASGDTSAGAAERTPRREAQRAEIVAAALRALHSHATTPKVAGCELPSGPLDGADEGNWSWSSALVVTARLPDATDGVHNLFCQPWLFEQFIAASPGLANEEGKSAWPLLGLFDSNGIVSMDDESTWVGHGGELRPADQHCHLVGDPPVELEPGMFFTPEPEWLIGADMGKLGLAADKPCCSALVACVQASADGGEFRCLLLRLLVLDTPHATAATSAILDMSVSEVGTTVASKLARVAQALREAGGLDAAEEASLARWRGD
jgi:hypothetical protein